MVLTGLVQLVKNARIFHQLFLRLVDYAQENEALISSKLFALFPKNRPRKISSYTGLKRQNGLNETFVWFSPLHLMKSDSTLLKKKKKQQNTRFGDISYLLCSCSKQNLYIFSYLHVSSISPLLMQLLKEEENTIELHVKAGYERIYLIEYQT